MTSMSVSSSPSNPSMMKAAMTAHQPKASAKPNSTESHKTSQSAQAGGNGKPSAPVSTSTKTVQSPHRIDLKV